MPGQVYNVLYVVVRNGTVHTFDASSGFRVRFPGQHNSVPILTGSEQWKPGQEFVFYVLTKKYYPVPNVVSSSFEFDLGGARSVAIPGPSGIFLRLKYNPATFARILDSIVAFQRLLLVDLDANRAALNRHVRAESAGASHAPDGIEEHVDRVWCPMKASTTWPSILAVALLLAWFEPAPCMAQAPPSATANPALARREWTCCRRRCPPTSIAS